MKKTLLLLALLTSLALLSSCVNGSAASQGDGSSPNAASDTRYTVTFVIDGESESHSYSSGEKIVYPEVPKKDNYIFDGWFYDEEGKDPATLGSSVNESVTLYAVWQYDYEAAVNLIFTKHIKAAVSVSVEHRKLSGMGFTTATQKVSGSGVIFSEDNNYYYIFTNHHVVEEISGYNARYITVYDCYGTAHDSVLVSYANEYDLAVLKIAKGQTELAALEIATAPAEAGDTVIAIGAPGGLDNSVTFGRVEKIANLSGSAAVGNLGFPVIWHDAPMDHGSSGGVLLNADFEIIGINYAVGTDPDTSEFLCGLAVGIDKINEFLSQR